MNDWYFPGHFVGDKVLFAMRPVEDTEFLQSLKHFWESWVSGIPLKNPSVSRPHLTDVLKRAERLLS
jgi:hypothetical protein